ncbi:MAG: Periplasmic [Fe] hydrogenase [Ignavibacteriae bacterium]|nr:MAG: Periplasmic [Fe] hydrogenase [Ignavibacteriota bacterium]
MRICPTQAIRVRNRKATLLNDRCIDCGMCVRVCPNNAVVPQTSSFSDFTRFKYTIALPSPVLYSQFRGEFTPGAILNAFKKIGFDDAYDVACASEAVSIAIQEFLDNSTLNQTYISPFCPVIVRLIQIRYPNLLENLIPIDSPMEIAAREAKNLKMKETGLNAKEIGVIYITPCPAKMIAIKNPPRKKYSFVDGAISIAQIYPNLLQALNQQDTVGAKEVKGIGLGWPILGGQVSTLRAHDTIAIAGIMEVIRIFEDLENGKLKNIKYIECHSCSTACVGGSLNVENPYMSRNRVIKLLEKYGNTPCQDRDYVKNLIQKNFFSLPGKIDATPIAPIDSDISQALKKMQEKVTIYEKLPKIDCGACGSPDCNTFAEDIITNNAEIEDCIFVAMKKFENLSVELIDIVKKHSNKIYRNINI